MISGTLRRFPVEVIKYLNKNFIFNHSEPNSRWSNFKIKNYQHYFSPAYNCADKWEARFQDPYLKNVKSSEFYYDLIRKYKADGKLSAIDADIFVNSIRKEKIEDLVVEMEEIIRLLRRSPETINTLPSTTHAVVRALLDVKKYDLFFKLFTDPMTYGIFLDFYTSNLLMDLFLMDKNFTAAARVASSLMIQEDFGSPLTKSLVLFSCFKYIFNTEENEPWTDYHPVIEPEEEVKVIVRYIRNPYFDDHFDLKEPLHIVGKTLAWLSFHLDDPVLKLQAEILGWSLYEKWDSLETSLNSALKESKQIDEMLMQKVNDQISACSDSAIKSKLESLVTDLTKNKLVSQLNIIDRIEELFHNCREKYEAEFIKDQECIYNEWISSRKREIIKQIELYEREKLIQEIKEKKEDLQNREDVIFFFENQNKFELLTPVKQKYYPKKLSLIFKKKKPKVVDSEYIPPEV